MLAAKSNRQSGSTLIETMIAMLILGVGMLAYAGMHSTSMQVSKMAQYRTVAAQLSNDFVDRMRANSVSAQNGGYDFLFPYAALNGALADPVCAVAPVCSAAELAARDLVSWRNNARTALPGGSLYAQRDVAVPVVNGVVMDFWALWRDPDMSDDAQVGVECPPEAAAPAAVRCMHFRFTL